MITKIWHDNNLYGKDIIYTPFHIDLKPGASFGKWTVLYKTDDRDTGGNIKWMCRCECGIERAVSSASLRYGLSLSCGNHNISRGNYLIQELLTKAGIPFVTEQRFSTCKDKNELPFDFYVNN